MDIPIWKYILAALKSAISKSIPPIILRIIALTPSATSVIPNAIIVPIPPNNRAVFLLPFYSAQIQLVKSFILPNYPIFKLLWNSNIISGMPILGIKELNSKFLWVLSPFGVSKVKLGIKSFHIVENFICAKFNFIKLLFLANRFH